MRKIISAMLVLVLCMGVLCPVAYAAEAGDRRVTIGADLGAAQRAQIYEDFGLKPGEVTEIIVTNADERAYLEGLVPDRKIGSVALSCVYITVLPADSGLNIKTNNINYCTSQMYANALTTAGISDARVMVSAPFPVSGTAGLTGIYKAYEAITGTELSDLAKLVGVEELVTTGELAQYIGSDEATQIINELKGILDQTQNMTDAEVLAEINRIATNYNVVITNEQAQMVLGLCRSLEKLDVSELKQKLVSITQTVQKAGEVQNTITKIAKDVENFFVSIGNFFSRLFGGK